MIHENLSAWITDSQGKQLEEFKQRHIGDNTVECWIPSSEGANFRIKWRPTRNFPPKLGLRCSIRLDGRTVSSRAVSHRAIARGIPGDKDGMTVGVGLRRLFVFAKQNLTDRDELACPDDPNQADFGIIEATLTWVRITETKRQLEYSNPEEPGLVHERAAKKGHGTTASLGSPIRVIPKSQRARLKQEAGLPRAVFMFRYGPEEWLKAKGITPNESPEPEFRRLHTVKSERGSTKRKREPSPAPTTRIFQKHARVYDSSDIIDIDDLESDNNSDVVVLNDPVQPKKSVPPIKLEHKVKREKF